MVAAVLEVIAMYLQAICSTDIVQPLCKADIVFERGLFFSIQ
jgi:hypothetical protein